MAKVLVGNANVEVLESMNDLDVLRHTGLPEWFNVEALRGLTVDNPVTMLAAGLAGRKDADERANAVEAVVARWKLSNPEKALLRFLTDDMNLGWTDDMVSDCEDMLDMFKMMSFQTNKDHVVELCRMTRCNEVVDELVAWEVPKLPVSGQDLLDRGMKQGREMGAVLEDMTTMWMSSMFTMTSNELLDTL